MLRTLSGWCVRHRWIVLGAWVVILVLTSVLGKGIGSNYSNSFSLPHTQSTDAIALLQRAAPKLSGDTESVVVQSTNGTKLSDPANVAAVNEIVQRLEALPHVSAVTNFTSSFDSTSGSAANSANVDKDHTIGFLPVTLNQPINNLTQSEAKQFIDTATSVHSGDIKVSDTGQLGELSDKQAFGDGTLLGVLLALIVLLLVFGSIFAAILPIMSALFALGSAIGVIELLSHLLKMPQFSPILVALIGLGVGVDYALFIVTRHRQGLVGGSDPEDSIVNAVNTSGRAVLFAGIIVCIALLGMFALGVTFLYGLAVAAAIGVLFTMIAALTLLPAMLGFIGPKVMSRKQKKNLATNGPRIVGADSKGFWPKWADRVQKAPVVSAVLALIVVGLLAAPFFSLRLGSSDQGTDPAGTTTRTAFDTLAQGFGPGFNGPFFMVAKLQVPEGTEPGPVDCANVGAATPTNQLGVICNVADQVSKQSGIARVTTPVILPSTTTEHVASVQAYPTTAPQDAATTNLIYQLRDTTIPNAVGDSGVHVLLGGNTAIFVDFANVLSSKLPLFIGLVVLLSFLLLAIVFRSLLIPLTAAVMNILSIGAAFGILVAVFEWGYGGSLVGINQTGPVEAFLPVMLFAILFGLSMDYQVFLVTRIHEEYLKCGDNKIAVRNGLAATGKTITAAALIMILVFGSFIFGGQRVIKEFGIGLAAGIFVDAVFIRMCVVPSIMMLLGKANWWFPKSLDRILPELSVDVSDLEGVTIAPPDEELAGASTH